MNVVWPNHIYQREEWNNYNLTIPAQAYMDNTSFLGRSHQDLQISINTTNQFYKMHDIFINGKKCNIIVINLSIPQALRSVVIGQDRMEVTAMNKEVHYLEIWILAKQSKIKWMDRLKSIIFTILKICNKKVFGVRHLAYIINRVLIPRLIYVSQFMMLNEKD